MTELGRDVIWAISAVSSPGQGQAVRVCLSVSLRLTV